MCFCFGADDAFSTYTSDDTELIGAAGECV